MSVEGGKLAGSRECGFDCGELVGGVLPDCVYKECERSINAYCTDGDPLQPSKELMDFGARANYCTNLFSDPCSVQLVSVLV